jgi:hypothetical protein
MRSPRLTLVVAAALAIALVGCGSGQHAAPALASIKSKEAQHALWRMIAEARQWEANAEMIIAVTGKGGDDTVQIVRPPPATAAAAARWVALTELDKVVGASLEQRSLAVVRMPARCAAMPHVTNLVTRLKGHGFSQVRVVVERWGSRSSGPTI